MSQSSSMTSITDSIRKIIEQAPGKGRCEKHHCPLPDEVFTYQGHTMNTYGRCAQCDAEGKLALEHETQKERAKQMGERFARMGIPSRYVGKRLKDFQATSSAQQAVLAVAKRFCRSDVDWASDDAEQKDAALPHINSMLLLGNVGTGKTLLGCAVLTDYTHEPDGTWTDTGLYTTAAQLMRRIKMSWKKDAQENEQEVFTKLTKPSLLVVDEIGVQFNSDTERCLLTELINDRYNARQHTIMISNLTLQEFTQVVGDRIVDRLKEDGKVLIFDWTSQRGRPPA